MKRPINAILVEDDDVLVNAQEALLQSRGWGVSKAKTAAEAVALALLQPAVVIVADLNLPDAKGGKVVRDIRQAAPNIPVIAVTGMGKDDIREALQAGALRVIQKDRPNRLETSSWTK